MKTMCPRGYHHNAFVATHPLRYIYVHICYICKYILHILHILYTTYILYFASVVLWDFSTLCVVDHYHL